MSKKDSPHLPGTRAWVADQLPPLTDPNNYQIRAVDAETPRGFVLEVEGRRIAWWSRALDRRYPFNAEYWNEAICTGSMPEVDERLQFACENGEVGLALFEQLTPEASQYVLEYIQRAEQILTAYVNKY